MTRTRSKDNLGADHHAATVVVPCANAAGFARRCVQAAHKSRAVYNLGVQIITEHDDEDLPLRSGYGYEGRSLDRLMLDLRDAGAAAWLDGVSTNIRRSAATQARTAVTLWADGQKLNAQRLVRATALTAERRTLLQEAAALRRTAPQAYRHRRAAILKKTTKAGRTARKLRAKAERYARKPRGPERLYKTRKSQERRERLTVPLTAAPVRVVDGDRTLLRADGFGDIRLKKPLPADVEPRSVTLVSRRKRRHRHGRRRAAAHLEWTAHVGYRRPVEQPAVHPEARTAGMETGVANHMTVVDGDGRAVFTDFANKARERALRRAEALAARRAGCRRGSRKNRELSRRIRRARAKATDIAKHLTLKACNAVAAGHDVVAMEDFDARATRGAAKGTSERPGRHVRAKTGLNRCLAKARPGATVAALIRACDRHGTVYRLVSPWNTSRRCAACGHTAKENRESQAVFRCRKCGRTAHADANAAENVRREGLAAILAKAGRRTGSSKGAGVDRSPRSRQPDRRSRAGGNGRPKPRPTDLQHHDAAQEGEHGPSHELL